MDVCHQPDAQAIQRRRQACYGQSGAREPERTAAVPEPAAAIFGLFSATLFFLGARIRKRGVGIPQRIFN